MTYVAILSSEEPAYGDDPIVLGGFDTRESAEKAGSDLLQQIEDGRLDSDIPWGPMIVLVSKMISKDDNQAISSILAKDANHYSGAGYAGGAQKS